MAPVRTPASATLRAPAFGRAPAPWQIWLLCAAILALHNPAALLHAAFWGEDGWVWYPDAYRSGWQALLWPHTGYLQTVSRLVALAAQPLPLHWAPTCFAAAALAIQALPPALLVSRRMDAAWPNRPARVAFALLYAALPNTFEISVNLTNAQWHLAVLAFLVLAGAPAQRGSGLVFDTIALLLGGLSGPFALFLLPVAVWRLAQLRDRQAAWRLGLLVACCLVQGGFLLATMGAARSAAPLGAEFGRFARIASSQVLLGALLGVRVQSRIVATPLWASDVLPILLTLGGGLLATLALRRGSPLLRQATLGAACLFAAVLLFPQVHESDPQWLVMTRPGAGQRYYFIPMLVWLAMLLTLAADDRHWPRTAARALLLMLPFGIVVDWGPPKMPRTDFVARALAFELAPAGTRAEFPVRPPGSSPMVLVK